MNKENLLAQIKQEFKNVTLGDAYTLFEEDYADTARWHFDEEHIDSNLTREEWDKQQISWIQQRVWFSEDIQEAIQAIQEKRKMINRFPNPLKIPYEYLNKHQFGYMFLQPQAFLFYTPSMMIHELSNFDCVDGFSFDRWLGTLQFREDDRFNAILNCFSEKQFGVLIDFLEYLVNLDTIHEINKEDIIKVLNRVQSFKSE